MAKQAVTLAAAAAALAAARGHSLGKRQGVRAMATRVVGMLTDAEGAGRVNAAAHYQRQLAASQRQN